nr:hypothetical protein [Prevotella sp.]
MSKNVNLDQKIEYKGYWYLPSAPETKVAGVVTYYPNEKITLDLIGAFDVRIEALFSNKTEPVIYGKTSEGKDVSLFQCNQYSYFYLAAEFPIAGYTCNYMLVGKHIISLDQKCQFRVRFRIPELSFWCHPAAIISTISYDEELEIKQLCLSFNNEYQNEKGIICSVDIDEETSICLKRGINYDETTYRLNPQLEQFTYAEVVRKKKSSILDLLTDVHLFEDFISLATLSTVKSSDITFYDNDLYRQFVQGKIYLPIHFIHPFFDRDNVSNNKRRSYLFDYTDIKDIYTDVLKAWFNAPSDLYPIRSHLIDSLKKKKVYGSVDFLILIQAIEGFWWRFRDSTYKDNNKKPKNSNTHLKIIITELLNEFKDVELLTKAKIDIEAIVDSRHYYSHFLPRSQKPKTLEGIELFEASKKLRVLLISCILSFVGLNNPQIDSIFKKCKLTLL